MKLIRGLLLLSVAFGLLAGAAGGQSSGRVRVQGRIASDAPVVMGELSLELRPGTGGGAAIRAAVWPNGSFEAELDDRRASSWVEVSVLDGTGKVVHRQLHATGRPIQILLPDRRISKPALGLVSVEELRDPPGKAFTKAMRRAEKALGRKDLAGMAEHLARAAAHEPERARTHVSLGTALVKLQKYQQALAAFDNALSVAPELE